MKIMIQMILLSLILIGCSSKTEPTPRKIQYKPINCKKIRKIKAVKKRYNYIVKIEDFNSLALEYSRCYKINRILNKILESSK